MAVEEMTTAINDKNQVVNEDGLPFVDPVEAVPPDSSKSDAGQRRPHGHVLPFQRAETDRRRTQAERAQWMDTIFAQAEEEAARELEQEEQEIDAQRSTLVGSHVRDTGRPRSQRRAAYNGSDEDEDETQAKSHTITFGNARPARASPSSSSNTAAAAATTSTASGPSKFGGLRKGFLNRKPAAAPNTTPSGKASTSTGTSSATTPARVRERPTNVSQRSASPATASASSSAVTDKQEVPSGVASSSHGPSIKPKQPPKRVAFKDDQVHERPLRGSTGPSSSLNRVAATAPAVSRPSVGSRLRFEDLSLADDDAAQRRKDDADAHHVNGRDSDQDHLQSEDEEGDGSNDDHVDDDASAWDSDEGYDSDDLRDLAPDLDADIDNAELAREYARARAGLMQSRARDEARKAAAAARDEDQIGREFVPLDATVSDPSASTSASSSKGRVSRFRASRLARAVDSLDARVHGGDDTTAGASATPQPSTSRNPLLVVPELAPIRYPKHGDGAIMLDSSYPRASQAGGVLNNVELDGDSNSDEEERLHAVMKARLAAMEQEPPATLAQ